jgi:Na+-transporting NADH:ubiquinone oxidoreductase subunit B
MLDIKPPPFLKQPNMIRVIYALVPVLLGAIYFFGWRVLALVALSSVAGLLTEWIMVKSRNGKISTACFVSTMLYGLSLPSTTPFWIAVTGIVFGILFGKEAFGGFGKNIFNPAIVGRAFVYVCFPIELVNSFVPVIGGFPGGFAQWSFASMSALPAYLADSGQSVADAISAATPMSAHKGMGFTTPTLELFLGTIGGIFSWDNRTVILGAGSAGEVSAAIILCSALYLVFTKTVILRLLISPIIGALAMNLFLKYVLRIEAAPSVLFSLFSGGLLYAAVFMVTEPVSAPKLPLSQWIYGVFIGVMIVFLRYSSIFPGAVGFSILFGNMVAPSLDLWIKRAQKPKTNPAKEVAA